MSPAIKAALFLLALALAGGVAVAAQSEGSGGMNCPMMEEGGGMGHGMAAMMKDMDAMMAETADPAMKARMQDMHDRMTAMMGEMRRMHGAMGSMMGDGPAPDAAPPPEGGDHDAHH